MLATLVYDNPQAAVMSFTLNWIERLRRIKRLQDQTSEMLRSKMQSSTGDIKQQDCNINFSSPVNCSKILLETLTKNSLIREK